MQVVKAERERERACSCEDFWHKEKSPDQKRLLSPRRYFMEEMSGGHENFSTLEEEEIVQGYQTKLCLEFSGNISLADLSFLARLIAKLKPWCALSASSLTYLEKKSRNTNLPCTHKTNRIIREYHCWIQLNSKWEHKAASRHIVIVIIQTLRRLICDITSLIDISMKFWHLGANVSFLQTFFPPQSSTP